MHQPSAKRLYRSRQERMIAGVCGGIAEYFAIDPTWVRLIFVILLIGFGSTLIIYILLWIIVPEKPSLPIHSSDHSDKK